MSKLGKILLGAALPLLAIGSVMAFVGWRMHPQTLLDLSWKGYDFRFSPFYLSNVHSDSQKGWEGMEGTNLLLTEGELSAFQQLDVDLDVGDLRVETGEALSLDLSWSGRGHELHYSDEGGVLKLWDTSELENTFNQNYSATVVLTLPQGAVLSSADITMGVGDTELYGVEITRLEVDSDVGDVTLNTAVLGQADLKLDVGSLWADLSGLSSSFTAKCDVGDMDLSGSLTGDLDLTTNLGSVTLYTDQSRSSYQWDLSTDLGDIWMDETSDEHRSLKGGYGNYKLTIAGALGDIYVSFGDVGL